MTATSIRDGARLYSAGPDRGVLLARGAAVLAAALGLAVLAGWAFNLPLLRSVLPGAVEMKANTAAALLLAGGSLFILADRHSRWRAIAQGAALVVAALGLATCSQYAFGWRLGIDELLFSDTGNAYNVLRGRMSPFSAAAFAALGFALAALPRRAMRAPVRVVAALVSSIGAISLIGYLWNVGELVTDGWVPPVALHTAIAFIVLGAGLLISSRRVASGPVSRGLSVRFEVRILAGFIGAFVLLLAGGGYTYRTNIAYAHAMERVAGAQHTPGASEPVRAGKADGLAGRLAQADDLRRATLAGLLVTLAFATGVFVILFYAVRREILARDEAKRFAETHRRLLSRLAATLGRRKSLEAAVELLATAHRYEGCAFHSSGSDGSVICEAQYGRSEASHSVACPVDYRDQRFGTLTAWASYPIPAHEREFLERMASQLGVALDNSKQYDDIRVLADELRRRNAEITSNVIELQRASRVKSEFLTTMSHELRTPLNAIIGFADVLRDGLAGELNEAQREHVIDIQESGEHLLCVINDILDLSNIEAGRMQLERDVVDVATLLQDAVRAGQDTARAKGLHLGMHVEDALAPLSADSAKLRRILDNLLSNAIKFSAKGGAIDVVAKQTTGGDGSRLVLAVGDTGVGISEEDQARLFQPFVQIDSSIARSHGGTGLGLALVRGLAELHGGGVAVASAPGSGSTFTVWLPYVEADGCAAEKAREGRHQDEHGGRMLALVVEDDALASEILREQLAVNGFGVLSAVDAPSGLALARARQPSVITLDLHLPGMDGYDFLTALKADPAIAHIPVVVASIAADQAKGLALGASHVLQKPVDRLTLSAAFTALGLTSSAERRFTVLVVDDEPVAVEIVSAFLEGAGFNVIRASHAAEAIRQARRLQPDLIILDLVMPEVSGFEVLDALKADRSTSAIPVIALSAKVLNAQDRQALHSRIHGVLQKSDFDKNVFIAEVRRALAAASTAVLSATP